MQNIKQKNETRVTAKNKKKLLSVDEPSYDDERKHKNVQESDLKATKNNQVGYVERRLDEHYKKLVSQGVTSIGYPVNQKLMKFPRQLLQYYNYTLNNIGDPFKPSSYVYNSHIFEKECVEFFARLWKIEKSDYWGYVTSSGTEGNMYGMLVGRKKLKNAVVYASEHAHYSIPKAAEFFKMDLVSVKSDESGEMSYTDLKDKMLQRLKKHRNQFQAIIVASIGTTFTGAIDNSKKIVEVLKSLNINKKQYYIHGDGALSGIMIPFMKEETTGDFGSKEEMKHDEVLPIQKPQVSFECLDSISVSGHKFLGAPSPCGVVIAKKKNSKAMSMSPQYLRSNDPCVMGSRSGHTTLFLWYLLKKRGIEGIKKNVRHCIEIAKFLAAELRKEGIPTLLNPYSNTVVFKRPKNEEFVRKWELAKQGDRVHVVCMPHITKKLIRKFVSELKRHGDVSGS